MKRSIKAKCSLCHQNGAGLICVAYKKIKGGKKRKCNRKYHFKCAFDNGCLMDWMSFKMLCPTCKLDD